MQAKHLLPLAVTALLLSTPSGAADPSQAPNSSQTTQYHSQAQAMQIYTSADGRIHAEIQSEENGNNKRKSSYEGNRDEVLQQIQQDKNLSDTQKQALQQALNTNPSQIMQNMAFDMPRLNGQDPFDNPFFKHDPFDDPMFKEMMKNLPRLDEMHPLNFLPPNSPAVTAPPASTRGNY